MISFWEKEIKEKGYDFVLASTQSNEQTQFFYRKNGYIDKRVAEELSKLHKIDFTKYKDKCKAYYDTKEVNWKFYLEKIENGGDLSDYSESFKADYKAKFGWLEYNLKRITGIGCIDDEEKKLGEKEVVRSINEIKMFDLYRNDMEITN